MTQYAVCKGRTLMHGVATKTGNGKEAVTTVETKKFSAGELVEIDDQDEIDRLIELGTIRKLGSDPAPVVTSGPTVTTVESAEGE